MTKRRILIVALVVSLVAIIACGTLAYFTSSADITNKFMIASYDPADPDKEITPDDVFSIKIYETDNKDGGITEEGNTYENIAPGDKLSKDPTVENTGDYAAWARMKVTLTNAANWQAAAKAYNMNVTDIFVGLDTANWTADGAGVLNAEADTLTFTYYLNSALAPNAKATLFTGISIPAKFTQEDLAKMANFDIIITGDAIQQANTGATALEAFTNCWGK